MPHDSLDPHNWEDFRTLGHRMLDDLLDRLKGLSDAPAWQPMPAGVRGSFDEELPRQGEGEDAVYEQFVRNVMPYSNGNLHPRFFGWVQGNGVPLGMLADMLASGLNPHMAGFNQAPAQVEKQALAWMTEMMGFPADSGAYFASGGSMANILGLAVARQVGCGYDVREEGLQGEHPKLVLYCSTETHNWVMKAMAALGLGRKWLRTIAVDDSYQIRLDDLQVAIAADRAAGHRPLCVIGSAGTVNTGATDDLEGLADLCQREGLWFHIDGAFGALIQLSSRHRHLVRGMERADSLAFDLHKWMCLPFEIACLLVRDGDAQKATFAASASYLIPSERGVAAGGLPFADRGLELTRGFKALKVWMCLKAYGLDRFERVIEQNVAQVRQLVRLVGNHPRLEMLAPAPLNVACFRYRREGLTQGQLNALNQELLLQLQESGTAVPSSTTLQGNFAIRVAHVNHRTQDHDIERLVAAVVELGDRLRD